MATRRSDVAGAVALARRPTLALICSGGGGGTAAQNESHRIKSSSRARIPFLCLMIAYVTKGSSSYPVDVFYTHSSISLPVFSDYRPESVLKRWVAHPVSRKLVFAHKEDDDCPVVEDKP